MVHGVCKSQCILVVVLYPAVGYSKFIRDTEKILRFMEVVRTRRDLIRKMEGGMKLEPPEG